MKIELNQKNWLEELNKEYNHPAIVLWRAIELKTIARFLRKESLSFPILDLGCGEGKIAKVLFGKGVVDIGVDNESEIVKAARKSKVYKKVVLGDAQNLPFQDNSLSTIFSNSVIEHIEGIEQVLSEVSRTLKPGGLFIFTVPSHKFADYLYLTTLFRGIGLSFLGKMYSRARNRQLNHFNLYNDLDWEKQLKKYSFKMIYRKYYLSHKDIYEWDKICLLLRPVSRIPFVNQRLRNKLYKEVLTLLDKEEEFKVGGGLLVVARKE